MNKGGKLGRTADDAVTTGTFSPQLRDPFRLWCHQGAAAAAELPDLRQLALVLRQHFRPPSEALILRRERHFAECLDSRFFQLLELQHRAIVFHPYARAANQKPDIDDSSRFA